MRKHTMSEAALDVEVQVGRTLCSASSSHQSDSACMRQTCSPRSSCAGHSMRLSACKKLACLGPFC